MPGSIPSKGMGPGRGLGPGKGLGPGRGVGPPKIGRKSTALNGGSSLGGTGAPSAKGPMLQRGGKSAFAGPNLGKDSSLIKKGLGPFGHGRKPNVDKDGDPFTKRSPYKNLGNNSFF